MGVKAPTLFFSKKSSIRRTLLFAGLGLLGLVLTVSILAGSLYTRQQIKKNAAEVQAEVASRVAYEIGQFMDRKLERLLDLAASSSLYEPGSREQALLALLFLKNDSAFTEAAFLSREGKEVLKVSERRLYLPADYADGRHREEFLTALKGENFMGRVYTSDKAEPYVVLAVPIKASPKAVKGVIVAELNLKFLWQVVGEIRFGDAGYAYLVDDRGNLIAYRDPLEVLKGRRLSSLPPVSRFLRNPSSPDPRPAEQVSGLEEQMVLSTFAPVKKVGWAVVVEEPVSSALVDLGRLTRYSILSLVLGLVVGTAIILWVSERITRPIVELHKGAEIIGRGALDHRVRVETGDEIEELAEGFNQMAADLKTSYSTLEQKVEQRTRELRTLYTVSATVNRSLELKVVLREVIQKITEIFDFDATRIFLLDPQTRNLHLDASLEIEPEMWNEIRVFHQGQGIIGKVAASGEPIVFEDTRNDARYQELSVTGSTSRAGYSFLAVIPVKTKLTSVGAMICIAHKPRRLEPEELQLLTSVAEQIGVAVENARLFEEISKNSRQLAALVAVNRDIASDLDREVLVSRIAEQGRKILNADGVSFRLLEGDALVRVGFVGKEGLLPKAPRLKLGEGLASRVVLERSVVTIRNVFDDPRVSESYRSLLAESGFRSYLGVPVQIGGQAIGAISFFSMEEREFLPDEVNAITAFADQVAIAVANANLFAEVKNKSLELEEANRVLKEANQTKSNFLAAVSHELRTPLNVIMGNADLMRDGFFGDLSDKQKENLDKIRRYSKVLLKLINDVLALTRFDARKMSLDLSEVHLDEIIGDARSFLGQLNVNHRLRVVWDIEPQLPSIVTDALKLEEILQNLIANAFKFTVCGQIEIRVRNLPENERVEFAVIDTGIGIETESLTKIFEPFHQLRDAHTGTYDGVGLGLSIVKNYIELMQGEIRVSSQLGAGSKFTFTLPYTIESAPASAAT